MTTHQFRVLGRFHGDKDPRFIGPHQICFDCDVVISPRATSCTICGSRRIGPCGGLPQGTFYGCAACKQAKGGAK